MTTPARPVLLSLRRKLCSLVTWLEGEAERVDPDVRFDLEVILRSLREEAEIVDAVIAYHDDQ